MPLQVGVGQWRTSAVLAAVALVAAACGHETPSGRGDTSVARPHLLPVGQSPLRVKGSGFRPNEPVRLEAAGMRTTRLSTRADAAGTFVATLKGIDGCDSVTVTATGSKGSRASFNLSQIACTGG